MTALSATTLKPSPHIIEELLLRNSREPNSVVYRFVDYDSENFTYTDCPVHAVYRKALEVAGMLRKKGLRKGDRAIILSMQDFGTVYAVLGCMMAGVVFTLVPPPIDDAKTDRLISVIKSCHPKALISNYALEKSSGRSIAGRLVKEAFPDVVFMARIFTDKLSPFTDRSVICPQNPEDLVYLQYTSGSTSEPKGVRVLRRQLEFQIYQCLTVSDFSTSKICSWVPFFHNLGLVITILVPLCVPGAVVYHMNTLLFKSNPKLWIRLMAREALTITIAPGSAYELMTKVFWPTEAKELRLPFVTHLINGSENVSAEVIRKFSELFDAPIKTSAPGYGLSECVCMVCVNGDDYTDIGVDFEAYRNNRIILSDAPDAKRLVSLGPPVTGLEIAIANPKTGLCCPELTIGEIFIKGPTVADGYWGDIPDNKNFHIRLKGREGEFFATGDLGFLYNGELFITGRMKEMFVINGHNVYPSDLMQCISENVPSVVQNSIAFFADNTGGRDRVYACVESPADKDYSGIASRINSAVAARFDFSFYDVIFLPPQTMPRTDNLKLQPGKVKQLFLKGELPILYSHLRDGASRRFGSEEDGNALSYTKDYIFMQVKSVFDKVLKIDHYKMSDSFLELGGDSLTGFELLTRMEQAFGIKLDLRMVLADASVSGISNYIRSILSGRQKEDIVSHVDLQKEIILPEDIRFNAAYDISPGDCRRIFLTGSTGFLGAHLISSIIGRYPADGLRLYCHVRADDEASGLARIRANMEHYGLWKPSMEDYITPVLGDLRSPLLGLTRAEFDRLAAEIDSIIHNGAMLNFIFPYSYLRSTNVNGTIETLRLACTGRAKYYHYVSSYSVFDTTENMGKGLYENSPLGSGEGFSLAYSETKWVSEQLVESAKRQGLAAVIYRPGDICGSRSGIWHMEDMVSRIMVSSVQMGCIPFTFYSMQLTPVDYIADAIAVLSLDRRATGRHFHLTNPQPTPLSSLISMIRRCGYPVRYVRFGTWRKRMYQLGDKSAMSMLDTLFNKGTKANPGLMRHFTGRNFHFDTANTTALLKDTGISCPPIDVDMVRAYLENFRKEGCF